MCVLFILIIKVERGNEVTYIYLILSIVLKSYPILTSLFLTRGDVDREIFIVIKVERGNEATYIYLNLSIVLNTDLILTYLFLTYLFLTRGAVDG